MFVRAYYSDSLAGFVGGDRDGIVDRLAARAGANTTQEQMDAWRAEVDLLRQELRDVSLPGHIFLEFEIPRMGTRADAVLILAGVVFVIEFKVGESQYRRADADQCVDYALDLKNFHQGTHDLPIVPVLVATKAHVCRDPIIMDDDGVFRPVMLNGKGIARTVVDVASRHADSCICAGVWEGSSYKPTPTIIEAARALYSRHSVSNIVRNEAGYQNLEKTTKTIETIIEDSKKGNKKSICFVTGVPGAGKTLAGLNLANRRQDYDDGEHAIFLSGNGPLVSVLREALVRDAYGRARREELAKQSGKRIIKKTFRSEINVLIQALHHFLHETVKDPKPTHERVAIFDEAQRAWDVTATDKFLKKKGLAEMHKSQPELMLEVMGRHEDWSVIVCLIGGGQEINHNEAGLPGWLDAACRHGSEWDVYISDTIEDKGDDEHLQGRSIADMLGPDVVPNRRPGLHLDTSIRSFRSKNMSQLVKTILDVEPDKARDLLREVCGQRYPIVMTRDFECAKNWLRRMARGSERFGVIAAAKSYRLKPHGIYVELAANAIHWFLNPRDDPRSSYSLEYAATEFEVQGLELDWTCVAWDADLRYEDSGWLYREFSGDKWKKIHKDYRKKYLENAYRVLLTRARQGMVIFVPRGDSDDETRRDDFYDGTYCYLKKIGIREI